MVQKVLKYINRSVMATATALVITTSTATAGAVYNGLGGLTQTPDGSSLFVAASNRVIYRVDTETLKVTGRYWVNAQPQQIWVTSDGKTYCFIAATTH